jgi:uncharacterized protein (DUF849 family)
MGATSTLNAIIKIVKQGGGDRDTIAALTSVKKAIADAGVILGVAAAAAFALDRVLDATAGEFVKYATQIEDISRVTGLSVEDTSRLVQVMDDLFVSQDALTKGMEYAIRQGIKPSVEWLKQMADEVAAMPAGADRTKRSIQLFGRAAGPEMEKLLEQGSAGIDQYMASVEAGLVLTDDSIRKAHDYKVAVDALNDAWMAFKMGGGQVAIDFLTTGIKLLTVIEEGVTTNVQTWKQLGDVMAMHFESFAAISGHTVEAFHAQMAGAEDLIVDYKGLLTLTMDLGTETHNYTQKMDDLVSKQDDLFQKISALELLPYLTQAQKDELAQLRGDLENVNTDITNVGIAHEEAGKKIIFNLLLARLSADGLTEGEYNMAIQAGVSLGIFDQATADTAVAIDGLVTAFGNGQGTVDDFNGALQAITNAPHDQRFDIRVTTYYESHGANTAAANAIVQQRGVVGYAGGGDFMVTKPTLIMVGEGFQPERVQVTPTGTGSGNGGTTEVNVYLDSRLIQKRLADNARQRGVG